MGTVINYYMAGTRCFTCIRPSRNMTDRLAKLRYALKVGWSGNKSPFLSWGQESQSAPLLVLF